MCADFLHGALRACAGRACVRACKVVECGGQAVVSYKRDHLLEWF